MGLAKNWTKLKVSISAKTYPERGEDFADEEEVFCGADCQGIETSRSRRPDPRSQGSSTLSMTIPSNLGSTR